MTKHQNYGNSPIPVRLPTEEMQGSYCDLVLKFIRLPIVSMMFFLQVNSVQNVTALTCLFQFEAVPHSCFDFHVLDFLERNSLNT